MGRFSVLSAAVILLAACSSTTRQDGVLATGGTSGGGATGGEAGSAGEDLCARYCDTLATSCADDFAQFVSRATCLEYCAQLPTGSPGDEIGNSVHCRLKQAEIARDVAEPSEHCAEAGPGGNGTCGSNCEAYCVVFEQICGARFDDEFVGRADCNTHCTDLPDDERFTTSISSGNSIQCRLWHVSAAAVDPSTHCGHAAGEAPCAAAEGN